MSSREPTTGAALGRPTQPPPQQLARIAGVFFIITFISAIAGLLLYDPVLNDTDYLIVKGFKPSASVFDAMRHAGVDDGSLSPAVSAR